MLSQNELTEILEKSGARLYFVGIGGIAMSAAACIAAKLGFEVSGSDGKEIYSPAKDVLKNSKIEFFMGYGEDNVKQSQADLFVLSAGENLENPEVKYIYDNNLPPCGFAELLYHLAKEKLRVDIEFGHQK